MNDNRRRIFSVVDPVTNQMIEVTPLADIEDEDERHQEISQEPEPPRKGKTPFREWFTLDNPWAVGAIPLLLILILLGIMWNSARNDDDYAGPKAPVAHTIDQDIMIARQESDILRRPSGLAEDVIGKIKPTDQARIIAPGQTIAKVYGYEQTDGSESPSNIWVRVELVSPMVQDENGNPVRGWVPLMGTFA